MDEASLIGSTFGDRYRLLEVIGPDGGEAVLVHQDARVFVSRLTAGMSVAHDLGEGRGVYLYVIESDATVNARAAGVGRRGASHSASSAANGSTPSARSSPAQW